MLYTNGGVYVDIKYRCVPTFRLVELTWKEHFVRDIFDACVYTALIVTRPKNEVMKLCIQQIVHNVTTQFYGRHALDPTGPGLLGRWFTEEERKQLSIFHRVHMTNRIVRQVVGKKVLLEDYPEYKDEQNLYQKKKYYAEFWEDRTIYAT